MSFLPVAFSEELGQVVQVPPGASARNSDGFVSRGTKPGIDATIAEQRLNAYTAPSDARIFITGVSFEPYDLTGSPSAPDVSVGTDGNDGDIIAQVTLTGTPAEKRMFTILIDGASVILDPGQSLNIIIKAASTGGTLKLIPHVRGIAMQQ